MVWKENVKSEFLGSLGQKVQIQRGEKFRTGLDKLVLAQKVQIFGEIRFLIRCNFSMVFDWLYLIFDFPKNFYRF